MISFLANGDRWAAPGAAVCALGCLALVAGEGPKPALVNESASLPRGLYLRRPGADPRVGDVIAVKAPVEVRPYLVELGAGAEPLLLKRVAARGGDRVCSAAGRVVTPLRAVRARSHDRRGERLPVWSGCRRLAPGELFLLGDTLASFDSRYFGPVRRDDVAGVYREVVRW